jgi:hypothetical protein
VTTYSGKLKAVWEWPPTKDEHKLRSFQCLCIYQRFIAGFVDIPKLLMEITEKKLAFQWSLEPEITS